MIDLWLTVNRNKSSQAEEALGYVKLIIYLCHSWLYLLIVSLFLVPCPLLWAEETLPESVFLHEELTEELEGEEIVQIAFRGNLRVGEEEILEVMKTAKGQPFSERLLREDLKRIYQLGSFQDISIDAERELGGGLRLTFIFKENPVISRINLVGYKKIQKEELLGTLALKEKEAFDGLTERLARERLIKFYKDKGYYWASIEVSQKLNEMANETDVTFKIKEGKRVKIKRVNFEGNRAISSLRLLWHMETKLRGIYKEEELAADVERLAQLYANNGYILAQIFPPEVIYDEKIKGFVVNIYIDEGEQFRLGRVSFKGNTVFTAEKLEEQFVLKPTNIYRSERFHQDIGRIKGLYSEKGYIEAQIIPEPSLDPREKRIDLLIQIEEGEKYYLEKIQISGNVVTKEKVIRREVLIAPSEVFDGKKVTLSRQKIFNLGYFDVVDMEVVPGTASNKKRLNIHVKERKTGMASLAAGYSSRDGLTGTLEIGQTNLFGRGYTTKLSASFGGKVTRYNFSFLNPWLFDRPTSLGFNLYDTSRSKETYREIRRGGSLTIGHRLGPFNRISLTHKREDVIIRDVAPGASSDIEDVPKTTNSLINSLTRDTTDSPIFPSRGYRVELTNEFAGGFLGGQVNFYKPMADLAWYTPLWWRKLVLSLHGKWSIVTSPVEVPDYERFYLGGANSIRGYRDFSIHPRDEKRGIGGEGMVLSNIEVGLLLVEQTLQARVFFDSGNTWLKPGNVNLSDLKYGTGFGILLYSPIGPIRLDYGFPLWDPKHTEPQFHFGVGSLF